MASQTVNQGGNPWTFTAGGATALPILICAYDLGPLRIRWEPSGTTAAGDTIIIQDGQGRQVYKEVANGAYFDPVEQTPRGKERWIWTPTVGGNSGITLTQMDSGTLYIHY